MSSRFDLVTLDGDTSVLADFWSAALDLIELENEDAGRWIVLGTSTGERRLGLQSGVGHQGSMHLDLVCDGDEFAAEVDRLLSLGAHLVRPIRNEPYGSIVNLTDPLGNPFDLCHYRSPRTG